MEAERQRFAEYCFDTFYDRVDGSAVRSIYGKDYNSFQQAFLIVSGLPEKPSTLETFNRYLKAHNACAEYDGRDDVYIINGLPNNTPHPCHSETAQGHHRPLAFGEAQKDAS